MSIELFLYSTRNCYLCEQMRMDLEHNFPNGEFLVRSVLIDEDPVLKHQYGARVPVLVHRGKEISELELDLTKLNNLITVE